MLKSNRVLKRRLIPFRRVLLIVVRNKSARATALSKCSALYARGVTHQYGLAPRSNARQETR